MIFCQSDRNFAQFGKHIWYGKSMDQLQANPGGSQYIVVMKLYKGVNRPQFIP